MTAIQTVVGLAAFAALVFAGGVWWQRARWWRRERIAYQRGWDDGRAWEQSVRQATMDLYDVIHSTLDDADTDELPQLVGGAIALPEHSETVEETST